MSLTPVREFCETCYSNTSHMETELTITIRHLKCLDCGELSEVDHHGNKKILEKGVRGKMMK